MRFAVSVPPSGELADARALADLALEAEALGYEAFFLWDHVLRPPTDPKPLADAWVSLSAIAMATSRIRLGPLVTPLTRRRPIKLARETITLDHLSNGRLIMGLGLGVDSGGELTRFGEIADPIIRGRRLDEALTILCGLWTGEPYSFHGEHFIVDDVTCLPRPHQDPRPPLWFAARAGSIRPVRRAARFDGLAPVNVTLDELKVMVDLVMAERSSLDGFDIAIVDGKQGPPHQDIDVLAAAGVTWYIVEPQPGATTADVSAQLRRYAPSPN
jgi:alkanesulfonate monooxygenase SsuD/methylene tetrahydromethanopterin reductase-like flavin-dependent oxidoreductase (luciferase family)